MCLCLFDNSEETIVEKPFSVFKVAKLLNGIIVSPFFHKKLEGEVTSNITVRYDNVLRRTVINVGLHTFLYQKDAEKYIEDLGDERLFILPCVVPVGARSYVGETLCKGKSYCSMVSDKLLI